MLTVWGRENSTNVKKVLWLLEELGEQYQLINAGGQYGKNTEASFLALNPNGLVPCLQDGDFVLWESNAILRYLAERAAQPQFWGSDARQRASADKWLDWASGTLAIPFRQVYVSLIRTPEDQRDPQVIAAGMAAFEKAWAMLDEVLAKQTWLSGEQFGLGDIPVGCLAYAWFSLDIERQKHPHVERWYQQLTQRPGYQQHVMIALT